MIAEEVVPKLIGSPIRHAARIAGGRGAAAAEQRRDVPRNEALQVHRHAADATPATTAAAAAAATAAAAAQQQQASPLKLCLVASAPRRVTQL